MMPTVCVVDDDAALRDSLRRLLATENLPVRTYACAEDYLAADPCRAPGCLVLDMHMPGMGGMALLERLAGEGGAPPVVVVTGRADVRMAVRALKLGALEFIEKPYDDEELLACVRTALAHDLAARRAQAAAQAVARLLAQLTPREAEIARRYARGRSCKEIARDLGLSPATVRNHLTAAYGKLKVSDKAALATLLGTSVVVESDGADPLV